MDTSALASPMDIDTSQLDGGEREPAPADHSRIVQHIISEHIEAKRRGLEKIRHWRDRWRRDLAEVLQAVDKGVKGKIHIAALRRVFVTWQRMMRDALQPDGDGTLYDPATEDEIDALTAETQTNLVRHQLRQGRYSRELLDRECFDYVIHGSAWQRLHWRHETGVRVIRTRIREAEMSPLGIPTGRQIERIVAKRQNITLHNRPELKSINLFSIIPGDVDVEDVNELDYLCLEGGISHAKLKSQEFRWEEVVESGQVVLRTVGKYRAINRIDPRQERWVPRVGAHETEDDNPHEPSHRDPEPRMMGYLHDEVFWRLNLRRILFSKDREGEPLYSPEEMSSFLMAYGLEQDDLNPGGWYVCEFIDDQHMIRCERNPFPDEQLPIHHTSFGVRRGCLFGDGISELGGPLARALDRLVSAVLRGTVKGSRMDLAVDDSLINTEHGSLENQIAKRGEDEALIIHLQGGADVRQAIQPIKVDPQVVEFGLRGQAAAFNLLRDITGAQAEQQGLSSPGEKTASEINALMETSTGSAMLQSARFEEAMISAPLDMIWRLNREMIRGTVAIQVIGADGQWIPQTVSDWMLTGDVVPRARRVTDISNKTVKAQALANISALYGDHVDPFTGMPILDMRESGIASIRLLDVPVNPRRLFPRIAPPMMPGQPGTPGMPSPAVPAAGGPGQIPILRNQQDVEQKQLNV